MAYSEKFLLAQISSAAVTGRLNIPRGISGEMASSGRIPDVNIHYGTTEFWNSQPGLIGEKAHIYVYSDFGEAEIDGETVTVPNIKIGDGNAFLIDNPFITASVSDIINMHQSDGDVHISAAERVLWNEKIRCYIDPGDPENVIFTDK